MREHEAVALQERLLRERRAQEEHAVLQRLDSAASSGPQGLPPAAQQQKEQGHAGRHGPQREQQDPALGRQRLFSAADGAAGGGWSDYTAAWVQQQQAQQAQGAHRHEAAPAAVGRAPAEQPWPGSGLSDVPLDGATYAAAAEPVGRRLGSPLGQRRPASSLSEAPGEAGSYQFPDAAAAGYAAGLAAAEAEGLAAAHADALHTPEAAPVRWHRGIDGAAEGRGRSPSPSPSWQQRDLHVVLNALYDGGEGGARRQH